VWMGFMKFIISRNGPVLSNEMEINQL